MTIERTKHLLGDRVKNMTDQEIQEMIQKFSQMAEVAIEAIKRHSRCATTKAMI